MTSSCSTNLPDIHQREPATFPSGPSLDEVHPNRPILTTATTHPGKDAFEIMYSGTYFHGALLPSDCHRFCHSGDSWSWVLDNLAKGEGQTPEKFRRVTKGRLGYDLMISIQGRTNRTPGQHEGTQVDGSFRFNGDESRAYTIFQHIGVALRNMIMASWVACMHVFLQKFISESHLDHSSSTSWEEVGADVWIVAVHKALHLPTSDSGKESTALRDMVNSHRAVVLSRW
ncbi:hypothetical protein BDQ17DRAFT_1328447 [Cyathus striatus]|nr:hypothetical protein BDQ17DRAFT_1328447 [Cyathus striatus]